MPSVFGVAAQPAPCSMLARTFRCRRRTSSSSLGFAGSSVGVVGSSPSRRGRTELAARRPRSVPWRVLPMMSSKLLCQKPSDPSERRCRLWPSRNSLRQIEDALDVVVVDVADHQQVDGERLASPQARGPSRISSRRGLQMRPVDAPRGRRRSGSGPARSWCRSAAAGSRPCARGGTSRLKIMSRLLRSIWNARSTSSMPWPWKLRSRPRSVALSHRISLDAPRLADQLRVARHQHRRRAADVRRGHAGAVEIAPLVVRERRADALAGRDEVGLQPAVAGRAAAREEADAVGVRPEPVRGADGDHAIGVAGIGDAERGIALVRAVLGLEVLVAAVAGRGDDDDAAVHQPLALVADRRAAAGVVAHVVRDRQAQVGAVDRDEAVALVEVADVLRARR